MREVVEADAGYSLVMNFCYCAIFVEAATEGNGQGWVMGQTDRQMAVGID